MMKKRLTSFPHLNMHSQLYRIQRCPLHTKYAIVGGGTAGMNTAAQLLSSGLATPSEITVFDPSRVHYYQPGFTMVAGGVLGDDMRIRCKHSRLLRRPMQELFNPDIRLMSDAVNEYEPDQNRLQTFFGTCFTLLVCTGVELRYDLIDGALEALDDPHSPVGSMYHFDYAMKMNRIRRRFKGGRVIATQPPMPFKCGGAPQKFIYLTEHEFRKMGVREQVEQFTFYTPLHTMFGVKKYDRELRELVSNKGIVPKYNHELVKIDNEKNVAWFKNTVTGEIISDKYDLMNLCPPQKPNAYTAAAPFSNAAGYVDVDMYTLQSKLYENVFAMGDGCSTSNAKTAAAVFAQTPTVIENIRRQKQKEPLLPSFDGYASCPIFVGDGKLLLAEFIYGGVPKETFARYLGVDQAAPRKSFYYLKRDVFPFAYWNLAPRGRWYGTSGIFPPKLKAVN